MRTVQPAAGGVMSGPAWRIGVIFTSGGTVSVVCCGDFRRACELARETVARNTTDDPFDAAGDRAQGVLIRELESLAGSPKVSGTMLWAEESKLVRFLADCPDSSWPSGDDGGAS